MKDTFSEKLIENYINHMFKKYGAVISISQAESDLNSLSALYTSFALIKHK